MNTALIAKINEFITDNRNREIKGPVLNQVLRDMVTQSVAEVTYAGLSVLIANHQISPGTVYKMTDRGDRGIFLTGITDHSVSSEGTRVMLCPATYVVGSFGGQEWKGVWRETKTAAVDDLFIWGAQVWKNKTGAIGTPTSETGLDGTNWELVSKAGFSQGEYVEMIFRVAYDFANDWIEQQTNTKNVTVGIPYTLYTVLNFQGNPADYTDWNIETSCLTFQDTVAYFGVYNNIFDPSGGISAVRAGAVNSNDVGRIQGVTCHPVQYAEPDVDVFAGVSQNACALILDVNRSGGIQHLSSTVDEYSYHTDDESFYLEWNFGSEELGGPVTSGNSVFRNCILNMDTALLEMTAMGVGLSGTGSPQIKIGLETDDENYIAATAIATLNSGVRSTVIGNKTTEECRRFKISVAGGDVTGGVLKVKGKYI